MISNRGGDEWSSSSSSSSAMCISLLGPVGCGKSALHVKYLTRRFIGEYDPLYEGCWTKSESIQSDGGGAALLSCIVHLMDTACDKSDLKQIEKHLKWSDAVVFVYSITSSQSFQIAQQYLSAANDCLLQISSTSSNTNKQQKQQRFYLLGNKLDMERCRQVSKLEVEKLLEKYNNSNNSNNSNVTMMIRNLVHMETTACEEYKYVKDIFVRIIRDITNDRHNDTTIPLKQQQKGNSGSKLVHHTSSSSSTGGSPSKRRTKSPKQQTSLPAATADVTPTTTNNNNSSILAATESIEITTNNTINPSSITPTTTKNIISNNNSQSPFIVPLVNTGTNTSLVAADQINSPSSPSAVPPQAPPLPANLASSSSASPPTSPNNAAVVKKSGSKKFPFFNKILNKSS